MLKISDQYLVGFTEGEGCFHLDVVPRKDNHKKWQIIHFFKVSQNPQGKVILDKFKKRLNCGYIKPNNYKDKAEKSLAFIVRDIEDLRKKVIPFFDRKLVVKKKEFEKFVKVIEKVYRKEHLTKKGFKEIVDIIYSLNPNRKYTKQDVLKV